MKALLKKCGIFIFWLVIWQIVYLLVKRDILVAAPLAVAKAILQLLCQASFYQTVLHSLTSILIAFAAALICGTLLAIIAFRWNWIKELVYPLIAVMRATPVASFIVLALVFMHTEFVPILIAFLMVMPLVWQNMLEALLAVDRQLIEMSQVFHINFWRQFKHIYLPSALPAFMASCKTGFGYAWKSAITAEAMTAPQLTIGKNIVDAKIYLDTLSLFAWTIVVILLSIITEKVFLWGLNKLVVLFYPILGKGENVD